MRNQVGFDRESAEDCALYQGTTLELAEKPMIEGYGLQPVHYGNKNSGL
jgi:hypothetical protein